MLGVTTVHTTVCVAVRKNLCAKGTVREDPVATCEAVSWVFSATVQKLEGGGVSDLHDFLPGCRKARRYPYSPPFILYLTSFEVKENSEVLGHSHQDLRLWRQNDLGSNSLFCT